MCVGAGGARFSSFFYPLEGDEAGGLVEGWGDAIVVKDAVKLSMLNFL